LGRCPLRINSRAKVEHLARLAWLLLTVGVPISIGQTQTISLPPNQPLQMLDCSPASYNACFRLNSKVDNLALPPDEELARSLTVQINGQSVKPFYASTGATETIGRTTLILVDVSGSMNNPISPNLTRFRAAKAAVKEYLSVFADGKDRVAVVTFESHRVKQIIDAAQFVTTKADALDQANRLQDPKHCQEGRGCSNTGLYSAVDEGLAVLSAQSQGANPHSNLLFLIVLTDGKNDVSPDRGDDPDLLGGDEGLRTVVDRIHDGDRNHGIRVIAAGVGNPREISEDALRRMSSLEPIVCQDPECLKQFFLRTGSRRVSNSIVAVFESPWGWRVASSTRAIWAKVTLQTAGGNPVETEQSQLWRAPEVGLPVFEEKCNAEESNALLSASTNYPSLWNDLDPVFVFLGFAIVLLILWLAIPRLIWGEPTIAELQLAEAGGRWAGGAPPARPPARSEVTPFAKPAPQTPQQSPVDATKVDLVQQTSTRSRLERIRREEDDLRR